MTDEDDRRAITAAMQRLFAGTPLRSSGTLDSVTVAQESGVKRNKLTHKHTDLKDLFYAQRLTRDERDRYHLTSETFARALHVLTIESDHLRRGFTSTLH